MSATTIAAGSIKSVTIHGREFPVDAECDGALNIGGVVNTVTPFGSGNSGISQRHIAWSFAGCDVAISDDRGDLGFLASAFNAVVGQVVPIGGLQLPTPPQGPDRKFLADVAEEGSFIPITITLVDDTVYQGLGTVVGPIDGSTKTGVAKLDLQGDGRLEKQS